MGILREPIRRPARFRSKSKNANARSGKDHLRSEALRVQPKFKALPVWEALIVWGRQGCPLQIRPNRFVVRSLTGRLPETIDLSEIVAAPTETIQTELQSLCFANGVAWYRMVHWIAGATRAEDWRSEALQYSRDSQPYAWFESACKARRMLVHFQHRSRECGFQENLDRFNGMWPKLLELLIDACRGITTLKKAIVNLPCASTFASWVRSTNELLRKPIVTMERQRNWFAPATLATWYTAPATCSFEPTILKHWLSDENWNHNHLQCFWSVLDHSSAVEKRRFLQLQSELKTTSHYLWNRIAQGKWRPSSAEDGSVDHGHSIDVELHQVTGVPWDIEVKGPRATVYRLWLHWLRQWPKAVIVDHFRSDWKTTLKRLEQLCHLQPQIKNAWAAWLISVQRECEREITGVHFGFDAITNRAYQRLTVYRKILRMKTVLPKSHPLSFLDLEKRDQELTHLVEKDERGALTHLAKLRLEYLRSRRYVQTGKAKRIRRQLNETSLDAALQASIAWIGKRESRYLDSLHIPWSTPLAESEQQEFLLLLAALAPHTRNMLIAALRLRANHAHGYRDCGTNNQRWSDTMVARGLRWKEWVESRSIEIECLIFGHRSTASHLKRLKVQTSHDPRHVLWMGRPFGTCLDLRGGIFAASVVSNWMDANKQLVVVLDETGQMLARQLLAITDKGELLTYRIYSCVAAQNREGADPIANAFIAFGKELASSARLTLVHEGNPRMLHGKQWYDDGPWNRGEIQL
jgi:hypothetical protein